MVEKIASQQTLCNIPQPNKSNDIYTVLGLELKLAPSNLGLAPSDLLQIKLVSLDLGLAPLHRTMISSLA